MGTNTKKAKFYQNKDGKRSIKKKEGGETQNKAPNNTVLNHINLFESWRIWVDTWIPDCTWECREEKGYPGYVPCCSRLEVLQPSPFHWRNQKCRANVILKDYFPPSILLYSPEQLITVHINKEKNQQGCSFPFLVKTTFFTARGHF